jgi:hypothetical protein
MSKCKTWLYTPELDALVNQFGSEIPQGLEASTEFDLMCVATQKIFNMSAMY